MNSDLIDDLVVINDGQHFVCCAPKILSYPTYDSLMWFVVLEYAGGKAFFVIASQSVRCSDHSLRAPVSIVYLIHDIAVNCKPV